MSLLQGEELVNAISTKKTELNNNTDPEKHEQIKKELEDLTNIMNNQWRSVNREYRGGSKRKSSRKSSRKSHKKKTRRNRRKSVRRNCRR